MTFCVHFKGLPHDGCGFFIYDQFLSFRLVAQRDLTTDGVVLIGRLPQATVYLLGEFCAVKLSHTFKD